MTIIDKLEEIRTHHALIAGQRLSDAKETENLIQRMEDGELEKPADWPSVKAFNMKQVVFDLEIARRHGAMAETTADAIREIIQHNSFYSYGPAENKD
jgi:hypothetical protein